MQAKKDKKMKLKLKTELATLSTEMVVDEQKA